MNKTYTVVIGDKTKPNVSSTVAETDAMLRNRLKGDYTDPLKFYIDRQCDAETDVETITLHKMGQAQVILNGDVKPVAIKDALSDTAVRAIATAAGLAEDAVIQRVVVEGMLTVTVSEPRAKSGEAAVGPASIEDDPLAALEIAMPDAAMSEAKVTVQIYDKVILVAPKDATTDATLCSALEKDFPILKDPGAVEIKREAATGVITIVSKQVERYVAIVEGTEPVTIDPQVALDDDLIIALLKPHYEGIVGAQVRRKFVKGTVEIHFIKQGGPKGSAVKPVQGVRSKNIAAKQAWQYLVTCKPHINPMIAAWHAIEGLRAEGAMDLYALMLERSLIRRALAIGPQEVEWVAWAYSGLVGAPAIPRLDVPVGF